MDTELLVGIGFIQSHLRADRLSISDGANQVSIGDGRRPLSRSVFVKIASLGSSLEEVSGAPDSAGDSKAAEDEGVGSEDEAGVPWFSVELLGDMVVALVWETAGADAVDTELQDETAASRTAPATVERRVIIGGVYGGWSSS